MTSDYAHWAEARKCGTSCETSETHLSNGGIYDTLLAELVHEALRDLPDVFSSSVSLTRNMQLTRTLYAPL